MKNDLLPTVIRISLMIKSFLLKNRYYDNDD